MMVTRLKRHVSVRSTGHVPGVGESDNFRMRTAGASVKALANDAVVTDDDATDERIGRSATTGALSER